MYSLLGFIIWSFLQKNGISLVSLFVYYLFSKYETLTRCLVNVGPALAKVAFLPLFIMFIGFVLDSLLLPTSQFSNYNNVRLS